MLFAIESNVFMYVLLSLSVLIVAMKIGADHKDFKLILINPQIAVI